jgi:NAD(P)-dependent dehydrogenase (short-subunit alcohol dehydrogenase family)
MSTKKSAVVTGAGSGIGFAIAERLDHDGFAVVGIERSPQASARAKEALSAGAEIVIGDVADRHVLAEARRRAEAAGVLSAWVNNAGVAVSGTLHAPVEDEVAQVFSVNLMGVYWGCAEAVQSFIEHEVEGSVVNISSIHGRAAFPGWAAYDTAKGGVDALTRYLSVEYGPLGIRANAVAPGAIRTEMVTRVIADAPDPGRAEVEMSEIHPLNRLGEPSEIASVVSFLVSIEASFVSGQSIAVDGAATARSFRYEPAPDIQALIEARRSS